MEKQRNITCLAEDYAVKQTDTKCYVYNTYYEGHFWGILFAALLGLMLPEAKDYDVPLCVELEQNQKKVVIGKDLQVYGSDAYRYFIPKHQYAIWQIVYNVVLAILGIVGIALITLFAYIFWKNDYSLITGLCLLVVVLITVGAVVRLQFRNRKRKKYEIVEVEF